ncbi:MAG: DJ-1/PfpI family protein [Sphingomonadales bacterium]|jgi:cyclohexyl-isocyanide hydratase|nr:DJ-1/PfpI family protein [Sphingomonadales bacterium]MBK9002790.1 DJ-1/PfpI family protein [Sphingomonadales bacterium]MBK9268014.1 DJ-1/PfpI family protein [Sphingomonadales bacterium]MBP6433334.1 DJ-1/PfpI family protein [Sphingorhabdus sp.]
MTRIVFVLFDNVTQLDFAGPVQFLSRLPGAETHVVTREGLRVTTDCGFAIVPTGSFADCPQADIICVPGGHGVREAIADTAIVEFVREQAKAATWVTSVCTGAFVLGVAGLLRGKRATTHWAYTHLLPLFGATHEETRVVRDGNLVTAGGVTSGIDFALELIALAQGEHVARTIQLALEYDPAPPFDGGHPSCTPQPLVDGLKARVYEKAASDMEAAIGAALGAAT